MLSIMRPDEFNSIYIILEQSFPPSERRSKSEQKRLIADERYKIYVRRENGVPIAFAAVWDLGWFAFIEHIAVDGGRRSGGVGGSLLDALHSEIDKPFCLEVEIPQAGELSARRVEFYKRHGYKQNCYEYFQPPFSDDFSAVRMHIMSRPEKLSSEAFTKVRESLYNVVYKKCVDKF